MGSNEIEFEAMGTLKKARKQGAGYSVYIPSKDWEAINVDPEEDYITVSNDGKRINIAKAPPRSPCHKEIDQKSLASGNNALLARSMTEECFFVMERDFDNPSLPNTYKKVRELKFYHHSTPDSIRAAEDNATNEFTKWR